MRVQARSNPGLLDSVWPHATCLHDIKELLLISGLGEKWIGGQNLLAFERFKESKGQRLKGQSGGQRSWKIRDNVINFTVGVA